MKKSSLSDNSYIPFAQVHLQQKSFAERNPILDLESTDPKAYSILISKARSNKSRGMNFRSDMQARNFAPKTSSGLRTSGEFLPNLNNTKDFFAKKQSLELKLQVKLDNKSHSIFI